jgi:hypothetical protein
MIVFWEKDYDEKRSPMDSFYVGKYDGRLEILPVHRSLQQR